MPKTQLETPPMLTHKSAPLVRLPDRTFESVDESRQFTQEQVAEAMSTRIVLLSHITSEEETVTTDIELLLKAKGLLGTNNRKYLFVSKQK